jgi:uncharacterized protein involved in type VI secretion and phage assembly
VEEERAKDRQAEAGKKNLPTTDSVSSGKFSQTNREERAREKAAEKVNAAAAARLVATGGQRRLRPGQRSTRWSYTRSVVVSERWRNRVRTSYSLFPSSAFIIL